MAHHYIISGEDHEDLAALKKAIVSIKEFANYVNESIRMKERMQRVIEIQKMFPTGAKLLQTDRMVVKEGPLMKVFIVFRPSVLYVSSHCSPLFSHSLLTCFLSLFPDVLLYV
jgi:hypothetical protein